jgi:quercetin dioxygenase-like cupin family protein
MSESEAFTRRHLLQGLVASLAPAAMAATAAANAQPPAAAQIGEADPGVRPTRLIDRAEVRVSRVEIQPGATRRVHTHDDVAYHLWIPVEGTLQLTMGSDAPVAAASG